MWPDYGGAARAGVEDVDPLLVDAGEDGVQGLGGRARARAPAVVEDGDDGVPDGSPVAAAQHKLPVAQVECGGRLVRQEERCALGRTLASATRDFSPPDRAEKGRPAKRVVPVAAIGGEGGAGGSGTTGDGGYAGTGSTTGGTTTGGVTRGRRR